MIPTVSKKFESAYICFINKSCKSKGRSINKSLELRKFKSFNTYGLFFSFTLPFFNSFNSISLISIFYSSFTYLFTKDPLRS